jgi:hypothetical protein
VPEPDPSPGSRADEPLRGNHDVRVVLVSQGSALGDAVSFAALPLLVFALSGSGVVMGVAAAAFVPARALRSASAAQLAAGPVPGQDAVLGA